MAGPVLTITSATVPPQLAGTIPTAYREVTGKLPHSVLDTVLVREGDEEWRIVTVWRSHEQLQEYRRVAGTPAAVKIFRDAGVEPTVVEFEVVHRATAS